MKKASRKKQSWQKILLTAVGCLKNSAGKISDANEESVKNILRYDPDKKTFSCIEVDELKVYAPLFMDIAKECDQLIDWLDSALYEDAEEPIKWYSRLLSSYQYLLGHLESSLLVPAFDGLKQHQEREKKRMAEVHESQRITRANSEHAVMAAYIKIMRENKRPTLEAMKKINFYRLIQKEVGLVKTAQGRKKKMLSRTKQEEKKKMLSLDTIGRIMKCRNRQKFPFCPGEGQ